MLPLILLHGALGTAGQFDSLQEQLPASWQVHALSFPGHGGLPVGEPFSMRLFVRSVLDFMDEHGLRQANFFGYSMGGYIALRLAATQPERVKKVATLGTKIDWSPEVAAGMGRMFDPEKILLKVPHLADQLARAHGPIAWQTLCSSTAAFLLELGHGQGITEDAFAQIICPVTVGWGELDTVVTAAESRQVAGKIPLGKFQVLAGVKHPYEQIETDRISQYLLAEFSQVEHS